MLYNLQLETFIKVADMGSFSKAAEEMNITPTAIIKQINILEGSLDVPLFVRTHRGISLTESGKALYKDAKYLIKYSKESVSRAKAAMEGENVIRIGTSPMTPSSFLVKLWPMIHKEYPEVKFKLVTYENTPENAREILKTLGKDIDIVAGVFDYDFPQTRGCTALELHKEELHCALSVHHPLAIKEKLTIQDLYGENLMMIHRKWNSHMDALREELWNHHKDIKIIDFDFYNVNIFNQCENSNNIIITTDTWKDIHPLLKTIPVEWNHSMPFGILHSLTPCPTTEKFLNAIKKITI